MFLCENEEKFDGGGNHQPIVSSSKFSFTSKAKHTNLFCHSADANQLWETEIYIFAHIKKGLKRFEWVYFCLFATRSYFVLSGFLTSIEFLLYTFIFTLAHSHFIHFIESILIQRHSHLIDQHNFLDWSFVCVSFL